MDTWFRLHFLAPLPRLLKLDPMEPSAQCGLKAAVLVGRVAGDHHWPGGAPQGGDGVGHGVIDQKT